MKMEYTSEMRALGGLQIDHTKKFNRLFWERLWCLWERQVSSLSFPPNSNKNHSGHCITHASQACSFRSWFLQPANNQTLLILDVGDSSTQVLLINIEAVTPSNAPLTVGVEYLEDDGSSATASDQGQGGARKLSEYGMPAKPVLIVHLYNISTHMKQWLTTH